MSDHSPYIDIAMLGYSDSGKTVIFDVFNNRTREILGQIRWHGPWRGYVFEATPSGDISYIYDAKCLKQLADFITTANDDHKAGLHERPKS